MHRELAAHDALEERALCTAAADAVEIEPRAREEVRGPVEIAAGASTQRTSDAEERAALLQDAVIDPRVERVRRAGACEGERVVHGHEGIALVQVRAGDLRGRLPRERASAREREVPQGGGPVGAREAGPDEWQHVLREARGGALAMPEIHLEHQEVPVQVHARGVVRRPVAQEPPERPRRESELAAVHAPMHEDVNGAERACVEDGSTRRVHGLSLHGSPRRSMASPVRRHRQPANDRW